MYIVRIENQIRRDFTATFGCEHCGFQEKKRGYDDRNFHENVVPDMECPRCHKKAEDLTRIMQPKYPEGMHV